MPASFLEEMVLVYEPVWAIGQREAASLEVISNSHKMVREIIEKSYDKETSYKTRILYGGSVSTANGKEIIRLEDVDGLAITRSALDPVNFIELIRMTEKESEKRFKNVRH